MVSSPPPAGSMLLISKIPWQAAAHACKKNSWFSCPACSFPCKQESGGRWLSWEEEEGAKAQAFSLCPWPGSALVSLSSEGS